MGRLHKALVGALLLVVLGGLGIWLISALSPADCTTTHRLDTRGGRVQPVSTTICQ